MAQRFRFVFGFVMLGVCPSPFAEAQLKQGFIVPDFARTVADSVRQHRPRPHDPWLGFDKVQHLTFSTLFTLGHQYLLVNKLKQSERKALPISMTSTAFIGLFKEIYDLKRSRSRYFSKRDLVADAVGILLGAGLIALPARGSQNSP